MAQREGDSAVGVGKATSDEFRVVFNQVKRAYVCLATDGVRPTTWKREGASSYTVQASIPTSSVKLESELEEIEIDEGALDAMDELAEARRLSRLRARAEEREKMRHDERDDE